jgi:hypothetical protein
MEESEIGKEGCKGKEGAQKRQDVALANNKNVPCVVLVSRRVRRKETNGTPVLYCME